MGETGDSDDQDDPPQSQPDPGLGERLNVAGVVRWIYLDGHRGVVSGILLVGVFGASLVLIRGGLITPAEAGDITALSSALLGGMLPFITVVLAINQLILSEEFGTAGTFLERLEETREYRRGIEEQMEIRPSPVEPSEFLRAMIRTKRDMTTALQDDCRADPSSPLHGEIDDYVTSSVPNDTAAIDELGNATFGSFAVIAVILDYDDPWQLQKVHHIHERFGNELDDATDERLDRLQEFLRDIHVARQYFKTVYMQQELADLSKVLLYVGFPTLLGGAFVILAYGNLLALELPSFVYALVVSTTITALFSPFAVLLVYVLRIATVARRTAADFGPFVLQQRIPDDMVGGETDRTPE